MNMGNPNHEIRGVLKRTAELCNNKMFSDVTFRVRDTDGEYKVFYAHKLILAMAGEGFVKSCYHNTAGPFPTIKITECTPDVVDLMLKFIYTDKIKFGSLEEAMNLLKLAKRYEVNDLIKECNYYLAQFQVDSNSVFAKYDIALVTKNRELLGTCRRLVSSQTKSVFDSPCFCNASSSVIEDILKLNEFSVSSELEVIEATLRWCKDECLRKNRPSNFDLCIRDAFLPLCKHLRFLSLEIQEFFDFEEKNKIFITKECIALTEQILNKDDSKLPVPPDFCKIRASRCYVSGGSPGITSQYKTSNASLNYSKQNSATNFEKTGLHKVPLMVFPPPSNGTSSSFTRPETKNYLANPNNNQIFNFSQPSNGSSSFGQTSPKLHSMSERNANFNISRDPQTTPPEANAEKLYEYLPLKKNAPILKVYPQSKQKSVMSYEFPLHEMQKEIGSCSENDIICHTDIKMIRGAMVIHEIELRVKDLKKTDEEIEVHLCFTNNSPQRSYTKKVQLRNSVLQLPFSEPIVVGPKNPLDIEVTIEGIKLNRCNVYRSQESCCELNCGLDVAAEINLRSNQSNGRDSFFFLINKILYSVPKY